MLTMIAPAKNMEIACQSGLQCSRPIFQKQAEELAAHMKSYSAWELESLLHINPQLAWKAFEDYQRFQQAQSSAAILSYRGLQYQAMRPEDFTLADLDYAQEHLRIMSALYGILCPKDEIKPYRLDYTCKRSKTAGSLYQFWGECLHHNLFSSSQPVLNLASKEYARSIEPYMRRMDVWIHCEFIEYRKGSWKTIATHAKMARGLMTRFIIQNRIDQPEQVKEFHLDGYKFDLQRSSRDRFVFCRSL